jgi:peptidoglycan biosynthesis protein MviN/MurJ (putative lipid II flippase)
VVAFQLALNFLALPVGLGAWPVSVALLPQLARLYVADAAQRFRDELVAGMALTFFLIVPATVAYLVLPRQLARAVAYGEMSTPAGMALIAASLAALAVGMLGEAGSVIGTHAAYARQDVDSPFRAMLVRTLVSAVGMLAAIVLAHGTAVVIVLGLGVSVGNTVGALHLANTLRSHLPVHGERLGPPFYRALAASAVMAVPAYALARYLPDIYRGPAAHTVALVVAGGAGLVTFVGVQRAWRSPELRALRAGVGDMLARGAA